MNAPLALRLLDGETLTTVAPLQVFVGVDAGGSFGLLAGHADLVTVLEPGLFRWRDGAGVWQYGACSGGVLDCRRRTGRTLVRLVSSRILIDDTPEALLQRLDDRLREEAVLRVSARTEQAQLDSALLKRLQQLAEAR